jgi:hypothetical protein
MPMYRAAIAAVSSGASATNRAPRTYARTIASTSAGSVSRIRAVVASEHPGAPGHTSPVRRTTTPTARSSHHRRVGLDHRRGVAALAEERDDRPVARRLPADVDLLPAQALDQAECGQVLQAAAQRHRDAPDVGDVDPGADDDRRLL